MSVSQLKKIDAAQPVHVVPERKNASKKKIYKSCARVGRFYPQVVHTSGKNAVANDNNVSETTIYAYVGSNPVNRVDPRGEQWWKVLALIPPIIVIYEQYKEPLEPLPQPPTPGPTPPNPNVCEGPGYSPNNPLPWQTQQWQNASPQQSTPVPEVPMPPAPEQPEWPESEP